jgi:hypothetical protein
LGELVHPHVAERTASLAKKRQKERAACKILESETPPLDVENVEAGRRHSRTELDHGTLRTSFPAGDHDMDTPKDVLRLRCGFRRGSVDVWGVASPSVGIAGNARGLRREAHGLEARVGIEPA